MLKCDFNKVALLPLSKKIFPLKIMKNAFYSTLKTLFIFHDI